MKATAHAARTVVDDRARTTPRLRVVKTGATEAPNRLTSSQLFKLFASSQTRRVDEVEHKADRATDQVEILEARIADHKAYADRGLGWLKKRGDVSAANVKALLAKNGSLEERLKQAEARLNVPPKRGIGLAEIVLLMAAVSIVVLVML